MLPINNKVWNLRQRDSHWKKYGGYCTSKVIIPSGWYNTLTWWNDENTNDYCAYDICDDKDNIIQCGIFRNGEKL